MRWLLLLVLSIALASASEEKLVTLCSDAIDRWARSGGEEKDRAERGVAVLLKRSPISGESRSGIVDHFARLLHEAGKPLSLVRLGSRQVCEGVLLLYAVIRCERGPIFLRLVGYETSAGETVITSVSAASDPGLILPPELLLPTTGR
jgi:hypothetical protein